MICGDWQTDGPTDRPSYRDARTHIKSVLGGNKIQEQEKNGFLLQQQKDDMGGQRPYTQVRMNEWIVVYCTQKKNTYKYISHEKKKKEEQVFIAKQKDDMGNKAPTPEICMTT